MQCVVGLKLYHENFWSRIKWPEIPPQILYSKYRNFALFWKKNWNQPLCYLLLSIKKDIKGSFLNIASQSLKKTAKFRGKVEQIYLTGNEYHFNTCYFMYYSSLEGSRFEVHFETMQSVCNSFHRENGNNAAATFLWGLYWNSLLSNHEIFLCQTPVLDAVNKIDKK